MSNKYQVLMEDVSFTYRGSDKPALENINLQMSPGEIVMLSGPAGAGKTTLCRMLNGLVPQFFKGKMKGSVTIQGKDNRKFGISYLSHIVGLLFQDPAAQLIAPTVRDEIAFGAENYGVPRDELIRRVEENMKLARLEQYADSSPHRLSGGEQQACALAAVMAMRPSIYVLDEPTSNLDPIGSLRVLEIVSQLVRKQKSTMLLVEHKMEEVLPLVDRLIILNEGKIILEGTPRELLKDVQMMEEIGLKPPQVALLTAKLNQGNRPSQMPITVKEAIKFFKPRLKKRDGEETRIISEKPKGFDEEVIRTEDLWHVYEDGNINAIRGVSISVKSGEFIGLIGQNGSGKTTLVKHFNGLLKPSYGKVTVMGEDTSKVSIAHLATRVGYVFQNPDFQICCQKVQDELEFGPKNLKLETEEIAQRRDEVAKALGLADRLTDNPFSLSKGERQKLAVASVLAMRPDILIVDEPTTGQDYRTGREMMEFYRGLNNEGKTVIIITHDMNLAAEYCERIIVLRKGRVLLDGPVRDVYSQVETLESTYIRPPQITRFGQALRKYGLPVDALRVDEMYPYIKKSMGGG